MPKIESGTQCPRVDFQDANKLHMKFTMLFTLRTKRVGSQRAEGTTVPPDVADCYSQSKSKQEAHREASLVYRREMIPPDRAETHSSKPAFYAANETLCEAIALCTFKQVTSLPHLFSQACLLFTKKRQCSIYCFPYIKFIDFKVRRNHL